MSLTPDQLAALERAGALMKAVESALLREGLSIAELTVAADGQGGVAIFGLASSEEEVQRADKVARSVPGVRELRNTLMVS